MPDGSATLTLSLHKQISDIPPEEWDACAGDGNPFVSHAFLSALEDSGSASARTGWLPQHAVLRTDGGQVVAVAPMYAKSHSYGEYVFDHGWAHALERAGGDYYPKLQVAAPFSPVPGPRLLRHPEAGVPVGVMADALQQACRSLDLSSVHVTFCTEEEWQGLGEAGWLQRIGMQFHWENAGYQSFDDFLGALSSRKRKVLRRERRDANAAGLTFHALSGADITEAHWDAFYRFYRSTVDRKWGSAYLTRSFFSLLGERLGDRVVLMYARERRQAGGRRAEPGGQRGAVRPQLGLPRRLAVPAFRALLLPRHRLGDRTRAAAGRGRGPGAAQDPARLSAQAHLVGTLDRPYRSAPGRGAVPGGGTRRHARRDGYAGRGIPIPERRRRGVGGSAPARKRFGACRGQSPPYPRPVRILPRASSHRV